MNYARKPQPLPVAEVKPGDFPLGSMESRAAARALAERKNEGKRILMIQFIPARVGHPDVEKMSNPPRLIRRVEVPDSVTGFWGWDDADEVGRA
jgi:hypothetical protein